MAIQTLPYGMPLPPWPQSISGAPSGVVSIYTLTAASHRIAFIWQAGEAFTIRKIHILTGTVTTGDTVDVRIESVDDATGNPSGSLWAANTNVSLTINAADDNTWLLTAALTADASITAGSRFALVINNGGGGGNMQFAAGGDSLLKFPLGGTYNGAAWTKRQYPLCCFLERSDGAIQPLNGLFDCFGQVNTTTYNNAGATTRVGNRFTLPFDCQVAGVWYQTSGVGDVAFELYDTDGTTLLATTGTIDGSFSVGSTDNLSIAFFTAPVTLSAGGPYRLVGVPKSATNFVVYSFVVPTAGCLDALPGGSDLYFTAYTSGAWGDTTTERAQVGLLINGFDDGTGGIGTPAGAYFG